MAPIKQSLRVSTIKQTLRAPQTEPSPIQVVLEDRSSRPVSPIEIRQLRGSPATFRKKVEEFSQPEMTNVRAREPVVFQGTPGEDARDWLIRFEEITETNKWEAHRLAYVRSYLEGTARHWLLFAKPNSWQEFRTKFLNTFWHQKHKFRIESRLRGRRQGNDELNWLVTTSQLT